MPERFEREYGCSVSEWMHWLPVAAGGNRLTVSAGVARVDLNAAALGSTPHPMLVIAWQPLEPRRIALLSISRLGVRFEFSATTESQRQDFMRHFDLTMQRGGG